MEKLSRTKIVIEYQAFDGKIFDSEQECLAYEQEYLFPDGISAFYGSEGFFAIKANNESELAILRAWVEQTRETDWCDLPDESDIGKVLIYYWDFDGLHSRGTIEDLREEIEDFLRELEENAEHPEEKQSN